MSMWYLGAIVVAYPFFAYAVYRLYLRWENRAAKIRRMINNRNETLEHRRCYSVPGCDMRKSEVW